MYVINNKILLNHKRPTPHIKWRRRSRKDLFSWYPFISQENRERCFLGLLITDVYQYKSIDIPSSVERIEELAFVGCSSLKKVYLSRNIYFEQFNFQYSVTLIHTWYEVGPYILFHYLIKNQRSSTCPLNADDNLNLHIIQKFPTNSSDDMFKNTLEFLIQCKKMILIFLEEKEEEKCKKSNNILYDISFLIIDHFIFLLWYM